MKKVTWLLFSLFMINTAFSQSDNDHTVKIKKNNNSSSNIEVEIVYKKKTEVKQTTVKEQENTTTDKTRFLIKRKDKNEASLDEVAEKSTDFNTVFTFDKVDRVPVFTDCKVNGIKSPIKCFKTGISQYIQQNFQYPEQAIEEGTTGKVTIKFTISKEGKVVNVIATDDNDIETLTKYSVELLSKLPKLQAGLKEGKPVATSYQFELDFSL